MSNFLPEKTLDKQTDRQTSKTLSMKIIIFFSFKIFSIYYGVQPTVIVESAIFKLLAVWHFDTQMNGSVWQTFRKAHYQQSWSSTIERSFFPIIYWGGELCFDLWGCFFGFIFFLTGHLSVILNWHFTEVSSRDIHLATLINTFWLWLVNSNDQSCQIHFIKIKPVLMM